MPPEPSEAAKLSLTKVGTTKKALDQAEAEFLAAIREARAAGWPYAAIGKEAGIVPSAVAARLKSKR